MGCLLDGEFSRGVYRHFFDQFQGEHAVFQLGFAEGAVDVLRQLIGGAVLAWCVVFALDADHGAINGNAATSSINFMGDAKNLSGANKDNAVNISGAITGGASNVNIQSTGATITTSAAITGANISIDNTNGTINSSTGAITTSTGTAGSATAISIGGNVTATGNLNLSGVSTGGTGINFVTAKTISGANIQATGKTTNGAYGVLFNGTNSDARAQSCIHR